MRSARQIALATYPPWFRERYGDELAALCEDHGQDARITVDLAVGAARAWLRPSLGGSTAEQRRLRLMASVSTVWVTWCVVVVGTIATLRLLEDPAAPGLDVHTSGWVLSGHVATAAIGIGAVLITAAGSVLGWRGMRASAEVRRLMTGPLLVLAGVVLGVVPLALAALAAPANARDDFPAWFVLGLLAWTLLLAVTCIWWTIAVPRALRAAGPAFDALRIPAIAACIVAALLLAPAGLLVAVAIGTGTAWGVPVAVITTLCTLVVASAAATGLVSAARGLRALSSGPAEV
ncbi:MAG TPA: hypothetical protein VFL59_05460 [Candidatus Nanopelagicales bacterium]|nr:hypothetical protein [Candidatus Nanopelagicales bacterium]